VLGALGIVLRVQVACFVEAGECVKHCACIGLEIHQMHSQGAAFSNGEYEMFFQVP
jgi:hypothetical protein